MTIIWCMIPEIWGVTDRISCHFRPFLPFYLPNNLKNQNFEKLKKATGDIIILHMWTINNSHRMYGSWDIEHDGCNCYFSFWTIFCPFTLRIAPKMKILKTWKSIWRCHHLTQVFQKSWLYAILFLRYGTW